MILADTSVWIDHFRSSNSELRERLDRVEILIHPFVVAELALGSLHDRARTLALLESLPQARVAELSEVRHAVESLGLHGKGIGLIDAHLIASVIITPYTKLWTRDKRLRGIAEALEIHARIP